MSPHERCTATGFQEQAPDFFAYGLCHRAMAIRAQLTLGYDSQDMAGGSPNRLMYQSDGHGVCLSGLNGHVWAAYPRIVAPPAGLVLAADKALPAGER
jgi:hypothetical protein